MLERVTTGWNFQRVLYVVLGMSVAVASAADNEWMGVAFGSYMSAMGLFALGCAGGMCFPTSQSKADVKEVEYEEIKEE